MSGKLIFKMEIYKYMKDKKYLIATAVLAVLNILTTMYFIYLMDRVGHKIGEGQEVFIGIFGLVFMLTVLANIIFMFLYPFHLMSMDYKNDVMALLVASGINRTRLFFSKIGATLIWSVCLSFCLVFAPSFIVLIKASQVTSLTAVMNQVFTVFNMNQFTLTGTSITFLLDYINGLVLISTATILLKGRNLTILLYIGLSMIQSIIAGLFMMVPAQLSFSTTGVLMYNNLVTIVLTVIFVLLSLNTMKKQNL
ncbi:MAG: hypothetical protein ACTJHC_02985 [Vagococcus sp.]